MKEVILVFDVGKTNKKILLFDQDLKVLHKEESEFEEVLDDEGFPCDDAKRLETWLEQSLHKFLSSTLYRVRAVNFTTYGATLVYLDANGNRLTPIYNYLKPLPDTVLEGFYERYGGADEFSRITASPALGMLNSGFQLLWLKRSRPEIYSRLEHILHLPQYLAYLLHKRITSELTSIGCHTALWDFDNMHYHPWLKDEGISLPDPEALNRTFQVEMEGASLSAGIGIHDSSSSLAPYILASKKPFLLISTGTWCISMNPYNDEPLTSRELEQDCLCFLGVHEQPVKSSRFFLGRIHDLNTERLREFFKKESSAYKTIDPGSKLIRECWEEGEKGQVFFKKGIPGTWVDQQVDLGQFGSFEEAYTRLMVDLSRQALHSTGLIIAKKDSTKHVYITGGFARNPIFTTIVSLAFPGKCVFISELGDATSLGAALVMADTIWKGASRDLDLGLTSPVPHLPHL